MAGFGFEKLEVAICDFKFDGKIVLKLIFQNEFFLIDKTKMSRPAWSIETAQPIFRPQNTTKMSEPIFSEDLIVSQIHLIRGQKVMLDSDLAQLFGVETKRLNEQVRRNLDRFPVDFMFQLSKNETNSLRSQFATSNKGGRQYAPFAFTEHGAVMLAAVLNSPTAVQASILVVRAFVRLRQVLSAHRDLEQKMADLEREVTGRLDEHSGQIARLFEVLRQLIEQPAEPAERRKIGFKNG